MENYIKITQLISKLEDGTYINWLVSAIETFNTVSDDNTYILKNDITNEEQIENLQYLSILFKIVSEYYNYSNNEKNVLFLYEDKIIGLHTIVSQEAITVASYVSQERIHIPYQEICKLEDIVHKVKKEKYELIDAAIKNIFENIKYLKVDKNKLLSILEDVYNE